MKLYLYGNCQMTALRRMILEQHPDWDVAACDVSAFTTLGSPEVSRHLESVQAADVVVAHPLGNFRDEPGLSLHRLRDALRDTTQLITLPSIVFEGTHGAFTYLGGRLAGYHMPYHNSHTVEMILRGYYWDDICALQASPEFYSAQFVTGGIEASLTALRAKETIHDTTIKVSPLLDDTCRSVVMMNSINHPKRPFLARVLNEIYRALSVPRIAREKGEDYLPNPVIPPLPTVLHHLGIADTAPEVRANLQTWTREQYLRGSLGYYGRLIREDLLQAFGETRGETFLASFHGGGVPRFGTAVDLLPTSSAAFAKALVAEAFAVLLNRPASQEEVAAHAGSIRQSGLNAWLQVIATSSEFQRHFGISPES